MGTDPGAAADALWEGDLRGEASAAERERHLRATLSAIEAAGPGTGEPTGQEVEAAAMVLNDAGRAWDELLPEERTYLRDCAERLLLAARGIRPEWLC